MRQSLILTFMLTLMLSCSMDIPSTKNTTDSLESSNLPQINQQQAENLAKLPLSCTEVEYPNKLNQTIGSGDDLNTPKVLHPAFYGCFDWHSAVHGHWSMVYLLRNYPEMSQTQQMRTILENHITKEHIDIEIEYFNGKHNSSWERTYGWAWLLKLAEEFHKWDDPLARQLETNLQPLTDLIAQKYIDFLPKLVYPIRVGEHPNTAFGLSFAYDYALTCEHSALKEIIEKRGKEFYLNDTSCPMSWEPGGFDFLSPCLEEAAFMARILPESQRKEWLDKFLPQLTESNFDLDIAEVRDRSDGKLVHLDGVNFSRAWNIYEIANRIPEYKHLLPIANKHVEHTLPNIVDDAYEGGHWLGSFAIYALDKASLHK